MSKEEKVVVIKTQEILYLEEDTVITKWSFPSFPFVLDIHVLDNVSLISKQVIDLDSISGRINIYTQNNDKIVVHLGVKLKGNNNLKIHNYMNGNNSNSDIRLRVLQVDNNKSSLETLGVILEDTCNNDFLEEIKVLEKENNEIVCKPDLVVKSNEATANHNVTIRTFSEDELFYLATKGIHGDLAKKLIMDGFINSMVK